MTGTAVENRLQRGATASGGNVRSEKFRQVNHSSRCLGIYNCGVSIREYLYLLCSTSVFGVGQLHQIRESTPKRNVPRQLIVICNLGARDMTKGGAFV